MNSWTRLLATLAAALIAALALATTAHAAAHIIYVTSGADSGPGTLRQAILEGNALSGDFPDIRIALTMNNTILLQSPLPLITSGVTYIRGIETSPAHISGATQHPLLRVDAAGLDVAILNLDNLVMAHGNAALRGCLRLYDEGGLYVLTDVEFVGCRAENGGAIHGRGGTLTINDSRFRHNTGIRNGGQGGAIYFTSAGASSAKLTIRDSEFLSNRAITTGPNLMAGGGAIHMGSGTLSINDSLFRDNRAVYDDGSAYLLELGVGGAIDSSRSQVEIRRSNFSLNEAYWAAAIYHDSGGDYGKALVLVNNTFFGNHASLRAGVVYASRANVVLRNNSFLANYVDRNHGLANFEVWSAPGEAYPDYQLWNNLFTAVAGNVACSVGSAPVSSGYNVFAGATSSCRAATDTTSQVGSGAHLQGYLLTNGLPGAPVRFFADHPAVDGGNPAPLSDSVTSACPKKDGQGKPRAKDGDANGAARCDVGAFEWQHEAPLFADDYEDRLRP